MLAVGGMAQAVTVDYTVAGWGPTQYPGPLTAPADAPHGANGYPGDTLELQTYTGTLDLTPGSYEQKINTLLWTIDYTYGGSPEPWPDMFLNVISARNISIDAAAGSLSQTGQLRVNYDNDFLTFNQGSTTTLYVQGYQVDVTPLGFAELGGSNFSGSNPWVQPQRDIMARFDVTAVPEPGTILAALSILGPAGFIFRRKRA